jgi:hypothetical protein
VPQVAADYATMERDFVKNARARTMSKYKVRFHLGRGEHYQHFQVTHPTGKKTYFDPSCNQIKMEGATLVNHQSTAQKIHDGANKTVCSWIECDNLTMYGLNDKHHRGWFSTTGASEARYNPRWKPNWIVNGKIADSKTYDLIYTTGRRVFII